jgi:hypothetical protein
MRTISDFEQMIVEAWTSEPRLAEVLEYLLSRLLADGAAGANPDGVLLARTRFTEHEVFASGVVVFLEGHVEPIRVQLSLDATKRELSAGTIHFGDRTRAIQYRSRDHRKLSDRLFIDPGLELPWKLRFERGASGWRHQVVAEADKGEP